ncbi:MAG: OFA family MFS transporter [Desulfitobacterium sp.]|nr:OFA family MFS transporter [Desulfitobacterium sp.]
MTKSVRGWTVTLASSGINLALGVLYTWSVFAVALTEDLAWSNMAASLPFALACAIIALMVVPGALLQERLGPRWVATLGGVLVGGGLILSSLANSLPILTFTFGVLGGLGISLCYSSTTYAAVKWFPDSKKGLISGILITAFPLASLYLAPLTNTLIAKYGINGAFRIEGLSFLIVIVLLAQVLAVPFIIKFVIPSSENPNNSGTKPSPLTNQSSQLEANSTSQARNSTSKNLKNYSCREMLMDGRFYLLWLMLAAGATTGLMIISQLSIITKVQTGTSWGFLMVALLAIFNASGRILVSRISNLMGRNWTMSIFFTLQAINMLTFVLNKSPILLGLGAIITGLCYGSLLSLFPSVIYDFFGKKNSRANYGLLFTAWGVGGICGPLIAGTVVDLTNSYFYAYVIAACLCLLAAFLTIFLKDEPILLWK